LRGADLIAVNEMDDTCVAETSEPESEVEWCADYDYQVGFTAQQPAGSAERQAMVGWKASAPHAVGEARHFQRLDRHAQRIPSPSPVDVAPGDQSWSLRCGDHLCHSANLAGIRHIACWDVPARGWCALRGTLVALGFALNRREEHIHWKIHEYGSTVRTGGSSQG
jgi:hypothetical protein